MAKKIVAQQGQLLPYYWHNGKVKSHFEHNIPVVSTFSQAMDYSVLLIEGFRVNVDKKGRCYGFRLKDYIERMMRGWKELKLRCPYTVNQILQGAEESIRQNLLFLKKQGGLQNLYVRPKIYHSDPVVKPFYGRTTNVVIECFPFGDYLPPSGVSATLADYV